MQACALRKNTQTRPQRLFRDAKVDALKGVVRQIQKVQPRSDELKQAEAAYQRETRRVKRTLEMTNFTTMSKQIRTDPHSVYATLKGRPKRLPLHLQTTSAWSGYVTKLAAGASIAARGLLNPHAVPCHPSVNHTTPVLPDMVHLDQLRSQAVILNDPISITEVQDSLRKLNNNRAPGLDGYPAEFLRYDVMTKPDGKREHVLLPALTAGASCTHRGPRC